MVDSIPNRPSSENPYFSQRDASVKTADPQFFVISDSTATIEELENALWQNIGGHEIISLSRRDLVDGKNLDYTLINNLRQLSEEYDPKTLFAIEDTSVKYFNKFGLKFENFLPSDQSLEEISAGLRSPVVMDEDGNVVIYVKNIKDNQEVEIQAIAADELLRDTIYEETL